MRISAQFAFWGGVVFAVLCWSYAVYGLTSIDASMTEAERADGRGFAMFFVFLGAIGAIMAVVSWLMLRGKIRVPDDR